MRIHPTHSLLSPFRALALRRVTLAVAALTALTIGFATAFAVSDEDHGQWTVTTSDAPIVWAIPAGQCSAFPATATVTGTGTYTSVTKEKTNQDGTVTRIATAHAEGTATDNGGNTYSFLYDNHSWIQNSVAAAGVFTGMMTDKFVLRGAPLGLRVGFVARYSEGPGAAFSLEPISVMGDPIGFPYNESSAVNHCDPI